MARIDRPGPLSSKVTVSKKGGEASPGQSPLSSRKSASTSRAVSPAPSVTSTASAMDLSDVVMESDYDSTTSLGRKRKRERGRPPTTGEYIGLLQVKQRLREEEDLEEQRRQEKDILNPAVPLTGGLQAKATDLTARFMEELRYDPAASLAAVALEEMQRVLKVASTSKGLKGTFIKTLKESACKTSACLTNLMTRVDTAIMDSPAAETEVLRRKLEAAEKEIALLRDDIATLKNKTAKTGSPKNDSPKGQGQNKTKNLENARRHVEPEEVPAAYRPVLRGRRKMLSPPRLQYRSEEEEDPLLSRLDHLFERWCERKWGRGGIPPPTRLSPKSQQVDKPKKDKKVNEGQKVSSKQTSKPTPLKLAPLATSRPMSATKAQATSSWATVVGRKASKKPGTARNMQEKPPGKQNIGGNKPNQDGKIKQSSKRKIKLPKTAAVTVSCPSGQYNRILGKAKDLIDLTSLGIDSVRPRRALTGAIIYEVAGTDNAVKAKALADKLGEVLADEENVRIAHPIKMAEMRVRNLDDTATSNEIADAIVAATSCDPLSIKIGTPRQGINGLFTVWCRCPLVAAKKLALIGKIKIGWTLARIELLPSRPLQCYKCLQGDMLGTLS
ncbi:uncharacterized protein [Cardiocondyla obscurior]|uniref:uncharacterized protein n=1 Tax=Cardiocondyla obscurior TaxID=286306 RepID=UPI003965773E